MGEIMRQPARAIQNALIDSVLAGLCALIVFGPIVGVVLKGMVLPSRLRGWRFWWRW